jgi:MFS transporter, MHS family, shikimate and dehydroshikimate transport protein
VATCGLLAERVALAAVMTATNNDAAGGKRSVIRKVALASFLGTTVEWYDFFLYGTAAALVFPKLFFPGFSPLAGTLASFATFGVAFFARPIGGVVFGHFGDRVGRKTLLVTTLVLMGGATFLIGLLPTFGQVGVLAPILLVALRVTQGFAVGGEWGGATLMVVEHAPEEDRAFYASWPQLGVPAGLVLSSSAFAACGSLPEQQFLAWGWRVAFLLSLVLIAVGLFIQLRLEESPVFSRVRDLGIAARAPVLEVLRNYRTTVVLAIGVVFVTISAFYIATTFSLSYLTQQLGVARRVALIGNVVFSVTEAISILICARLADRFGKYRVAICSAWWVVLFSYPFFWLLNTREPALIWLAMGAASVGMGSLYGIVGAILAELFEPRVRCSGISLGYQMAGLLGGAPTPFIATFLIHQSGGSTRGVAAYSAVTALITLIAVYLALGRHKRSELSTQKVWDLQLGR